MRIKIKGSEWYLGSYRADSIYELCYGFLCTGFWYAGGPEKQPFDHTFWGFVWAGKYTLGIGRITPTEVVEFPDLDVIEE